MKYNFCVGNRVFVCCPKNLLCTSYLFFWQKMLHVFNLRIVFKFLSLIAGIRDIFLFLRYKNVGSFSFVYLSFIVGFVLQEDGSCEDIDECIDNAPRCENNCTNTDGSYFCECPPGTALRIDGRTCGRRAVARF